jgi:hypothetical protein
MRHVKSAINTSANVGIWVALKVILVRVWTTRCRRNLYHIFLGKNVFRFNNMVLLVMPFWDTGINFTQTIFFQAEKTYIHTLTIYMKQSPLEADSFSACQAIPNILWNLKVCYRVPSCSYPEQEESSPHQPLLFKNHFKITIPSMPWSWQWY